MIKDILPTFKKMYREQGVDLILDGYTLKTGVYILIDKNNIQTLNITNKKNNLEEERTNPLYKSLCAMDYYSGCPAANKFLDAPAKKVQNNNYLTLFFTSDNLDVVLKTSLDKAHNKLKSKQDKNIDKIVEDKFGTIDVEAIDKVNSYLKENLRNILEDLKLEKKTLVKIFFNAPLDMYIKEGTRYLYYNVFNSNNYNTFIDDELCGLPDFNLNLNGKKPHLAYRGKAPFLLPVNEAITLKHFGDYLLTLAKTGRTDVYINEDEILGLKNNENLDLSFVEGHYLKLGIGIGGVEIIDYDYINNISHYMNIPVLKDYVNERYSKNLEANIDDMRQLEAMINKTFFEYKLTMNYYSSSGDIKGLDNKTKSNLINYRESFHSWLYKGKTNLIKRNIDTIIDLLVKEAILDGNVTLASNRLNLGLNIKEYLGGDTMDYRAIREGLFNKVLQFKEKESKESKESKELKEIKEITIENDTEYYLAIGMLAYCLASRSKGDKGSNSILRYILNASTKDSIIKELEKLYRSYGYTIKNISFNKVFEAVDIYTPTTVDTKALRIGTMTDNIFYRSTKNIKNIKEGDSNE